MELRAVREFEVETLSPCRVADKLARAGIGVLSFDTPAKNAAVFTVKGKDAKKVFAILRGSCYNIKKTRPRGLLRFLSLLTRSAGLIAGTALFFVAVLLSGTRVLDVRVEGSGAYYRDEVLAILTRNGVKRFSPLPSDVRGLTAEIFSLPGVCFCTAKGEGGVLTVTVEIALEEKPASYSPLLSPADGTVEELVVVRGTPLVQVGDCVRAGDKLVSGEAVYGTERIVGVVIARVTVAEPFCREYGGSEENARLAAELEYGRIKEIRMTKGKEGWIVEGVALRERSLNLT